MKPWKWRCNSSLGRRGHAQRGSRPEAQGARLARENRDVATRRRLEVGGSNPPFRAEGSASRRPGSFGEPQRGATPRPSTAPAFTGEVANDPRLPERVKVPFRGDCTPSSVGRAAGGWSRKRAGSSPAGCAAGTDGTPTLKQGVPTRPAPSFRVPTRAPKDGEKRRARRPYQGDETVSTRRRKAFCARAVLDPLRPNRATHCLPTTTQPRSPPRRPERRSRDAVAPPRARASSKRARSSSADPPGAPKRG